jgi:hypothetical protein
MLSFFLNYWRFLFLYKIYQNNMFFVKRKFNGDLESIGVLSSTTAGISFKKKSAVVYGVYSVV